MARAWLLSSASILAMDRGAVAAAVFENRAAPLVVMHEGALVTLAPTEFIEQMKARYDRMMRAAAMLAVRRFLMLHDAQAAGHA